MQKTGKEPLLRHTSSSTYLFMPRKTSLCVDPMEQGKNNKIQKDTKDTNNNH